MLKPGVRLIGLRAEVVLACSAARAAWERQGIPFVITSAVDGVHTRASKHYSGCAVDLRCQGVAPAKVALAVRELQVALGVDFDVVHEGAGTPNEHVHMEYDPKDAM